MEALEWMVLLALSVLGALKSRAAIYWWKGQEAFCFVPRSLMAAETDQESRIIEKNSSVFWMKNGFWKQIAGWALGYALVWLVSGRQMAVVRLADLLVSYGLLAVIDGKRRAVPDSILVFFFLGQLLLGAITMPPVVLFRIFASGFLFALAVFLFAFFSGERIGMGDAKLLGVTAMIAGWNYVMQLFCVSILLSFVYSILLLLFCRKSKKTEFPFVPFLTGGMLLHFILQSVG